jgi:3,4-dihydroxy 2-butanone 4-phosphate synthase/GTP cyclohydrolase II
MTNLTVQRKTCARIPTDAGEFQLCLYTSDQDDKEHLALIVGDIPVGDPLLVGNRAANNGAGLSNVLVRVHSECFTGDVLGSLRCDCGPQLAAAMHLIAAEGRGIIIYLRQEGRGIGLLDKLRAYNLQDEGYDTVDANLILGHEPDPRDYTVAALILRDLGVASVRLMTNNPDKIEALQQAGLTVTARVPLQTAANPENIAYLSAKMRRMRHLLNLNGALPYAIDARAPDLHYPASKTETHQAFTTTLADNRPFVTLSYAQSLDGSITARRGRRTAISGPEAMRLTHQLRARHDAILVGIGTVLVDDPQLTVRLVEGPNPQPVVVDSRLRTPLTAKLLSHPTHKLWIAATDAADADRQVALEAAGAQVIRLPADGKGRVDLVALLDFLAHHDVYNLMVEGGAAVITSFLTQHLVDRLVLTIAPRLMGGVPAIETNGRLSGRALPQLRHAHFQPLGEDLVLVGDVVWD